MEKELGKREVHAPGKQGRRERSLALAHPAASRGARGTEGDGEELVGRRLEDEGWARDEENLSAPVPGSAPSSEYLGSENLSAPVPGSAPSSE
jgi:hypothetical protein